jgi:hypothetical protein
VLSFREGSLGEGRMMEALMGKVLSNTYRVSLGSHSS